MQHPLKPGTKVRQMARDECLKAYGRVANDGNSPRGYLAHAGKEVVLGEVEYRDKDYGVLYRRKTKGSAHLIGDKHFTIITDDIEDILCGLE